MSCVWVWMWMCVCGLVVVWGRGSDAKDGLVRTHTTV